MTKQLHIREYYRGEQNKNANLLRQYGITLEDYSQMIIDQEGLCAICSEEMSGKNLHVDHDHKTGKVRALLCGHCNKGLGMFRDSSSNLIAAASYLLKHSN